MLNSKTKISLGLFCLSLSTTLYFTNCAKNGFEVDTKLSAQLVSTSCGTKVLLNQDQIALKIEEGHQKLGGKTHIQCPGFFAEIDSSPSNVPAEQSSSQTGQKLLKQSKASLQKTVSEANACNINGPASAPPTSQSPSPTALKDQMIKDLITKTQSNRIRSTVESLSDGSLAPTRYHASSTPRRTPEWILSQFQAIAQNRSDIQIRLVEHVNTRQPSVEALILGTGPDKNKRVIIGAHEDSIHSANSRNTPDSPAPGADDNASGVAVVLETFRVLVESGIKPNATLAFYTYAAEEVGLVGSQEIASSYANRSAEVLGVMQVDMASYSSGDMNEFVFISDFTSPTLTSRAARLAVDYLGMRASYAECGYGCSDHASWTRFNFHSFMPAEKEFPSSVRRIHTVQDRVDSFSQFEYSERFARLAIAVAIDLGM